jgi:uncharacterized protein YecE (DUF72 family)
MVSWYFGTMGFSYKDWQGVFYPVGIKSRNYLRHYSKAFNAVEVDATFYGTPKTEIVQRWGVNTPDQFVFCLKMPRIITHELGLIRSTSYVQEFVDRVLLLENKLGVVLIQLPPTFTSSMMSILAAFLEVLPDDLRFAVEFRHQSWYTSKSAELLKQHNVCWVATEYKQLPKTVPVTSDFAYVRFIGRHGRFNHFNRVRIDVTRNLRWWQKRIEDITPQINSFFGFFNNDYSGYAPATCNQFKSMLGLETAKLEPPKQERLF